MGVKAYGDFRRRSPVHCSYRARIASMMLVPAECQPLNFSGIVV